jgi:hypothetical protein
MIVEASRDLINIMQYASFHRNYQEGMQKRKPPSCYILTNWKGVRFCSEASGKAGKWGTSEHERINLKPMDHVLSLLFGILI